MNNGHKTLHIGVDATCWQNKRGYGRHARALLGALVNYDTHNRYTFFMDSTENSDTLPAAAEVEFVQAGSPTSVAASANGHRSAQDMWRMSRALSRAKVNILLFPTIYSYVPVHTRAKKIVIIHDVIAERYPQLTIPEPKARMLWKTKVALGRWQADAIATVSDYSRQGIVDHFHLSPDRVHVVGEASDGVFQVLSDSSLTSTLEGLGLRTEDRLIVYVGGFSPHKNIEMLVNVFAKLVDQPAFSDVKLVLVGEYQKEVFHSYAGTIGKLVTDLKLEEHVVWTGYLPDDELVVLLNNSTVSVLPSLIEGFGLPAVEAAACGCPVIATTESPLPSLLGEGGLYFNPANPAELQVALKKVLSSKELRVRMGHAAREAAGRLTWQAAAEQMATLIRKVAA